MHLPTPLHPAVDRGERIIRARVVAFTAEGLVQVHSPASGLFDCEILATGPIDLPLAVDQRVLALPGDGAEPGVILGVVKRLQPAGQEAVKVVTRQSLTFECGESSIDLRADGKVVIRGDDVLVRAKGTKRIRAGSVSIN